MRYIDKHLYLFTRGFTLFEVSISLALVTFGVISVLMMLPAGIQAQQMARYQILASAQAMELVEAYNASHNTNPAIDVEADFPWNVHTSQRNFAPDLESRVSSYRFGMFPLPTEIANRLDSDGNEIQRILGEGGYLYYSQPLATTGFQENGFSPTEPPNETQRIVMAVVGYPQNNALWTIPEKAWPYYVAYPSPPLHIIHKKNTDTGTCDVRKHDGYGRDVMLWEDVNLGSYGAGLRDVYIAYVNYGTDKSIGGDLAEQKIRAQKYAEEIVKWCAAQSIPSACYDGVSELTDFPSSTNRHLQVVASRIMAHAAPIMLKHDIQTVGSIVFNQDSVRRIHENAMFLGNLFAASYPYDWGAPRPLQRAIMMDFPLIEYDLLGPFRQGNIFGTSNALAKQWRPVTPQPVINPGVSLTYPAANTDWDNLWGDPKHSTLTANFEATERCRQIVFWAVDWQSYEDFETAPSAPVDAGRYQKYAPQPGGNLNAVYGSSYGRWMDHQQFGYRNPEKNIVFNFDMTNVQTGSATPPGKDKHPGVHGRDSFGGQTNDQGLGTAQMARFMGKWGADRNANQQLDRGKVPKSVRMRATLISRFNYYDMRVPATIR